MNLHSHKLNLILESKDSKYHAVPHVEESKVISRHLQKRRTDMKRAHEFVQSE